MGAVQMLNATTARLISEGPKGVLDQETPVPPRQVFCTVRSVGMREMYEAMAHGLRPEMVICLSHRFEYRGENFVEVDDEEYQIIRTYVTETNGIELTLQRRGERL